MSSVADRNEQSAAEAGAWLARLQRPELTEEDGLAFDAWLAAEPRNRAAYARALDVWHAFGASADEVLAELTAEKRRGRPQPLRRWLIGGGGLALAAGLVLAIAPSLFLRPTVLTFATGRGQHQHVTLADGSVIDLNAETRLTVSLGRHERRVVLGDGEAIFDVAHDKNRPFTVAAAGHLVRVVGTQFDVNSRQGGLTVTVARGRVQVRPQNASTQGRSFLLTPGLRLAVARGGAEQINAVDPQEAFSWRAGRLVYRDQPLSDVVADLNRQFVEQIRIGDPELGKIPITGVIVLDDPQAVTQRLSLMLPVRSVPSDGGLLLLKK